MPISLRPGSAFELRPFRHKTTGLAFDAGQDRASCLAQILSAENRCRPPRLKVNRPRSHATSAYLGTIHNVRVTLYGCNFCIGFAEWVKRCSAESTMFSQMLATGSILACHTINAVGIATLSHYNRF